METYDTNNIFAKIIRKEVTSKIIYESEYTLAINDNQPVAPVHILVLPRNAYIDYNDFISNAQTQEIIDYFTSINKITEQFSLKNFRLITNKAAESGQSVFHFHTHIISGKKLLGLVND